MSLLTAHGTDAAVAGVARVGWPALASVRRLADGQDDEALRFLAERPVHTTILAGWLREDGPASRQHRGAFYACRNAAGEITGLALLGPKTIFEARTDVAIAALALRARSILPTVRMILGEAPAAQKFWDYYSGFPSARPCVEHETLYELRRVVADHEEVAGLRRATREDLPLLIGVHAEMAAAETGAPSLGTDPAGFHARYEERVRRGHVWLITEHGRLVFKADVTVATPQSSYLEGVYVAPECRGRGVARRCLSQVARRLLRQSPSVCLFANDLNTRAHSLYQRVGFKQHARFNAIFPPQPSEPGH